MYRTEHLAGVGVPVESKYLPPAEKLPNIRKRVEDFARLAIGTQQGKQAPANWLVDRTEFTRHYRGSVYVAIGAIARKLAMQEAKVYVKTQTEGGIQEEPVEMDHVLVQLMSHVNDLHTQFDLWFHTVAWRLITGDAFWWKVRNGFRVPIELWPLPSQWVWIIPDERKYIGAYLVRNMFTEEEMLDPKDVVHLREPSVDWSASGRFYGRPPLAAGATMVDVEDAMLRRLWHQFRNYAPPGLHYSTEETLTPEEFYDIYQQVATQHAMAETTGRPIVSHAGLKVDEFGPKTAREMDYRSSLDASLEYTLAIFGVPKAVVGLVKDTNRANMQAALMAFAENTVNPLLVHMGQHLTQQLAHEFDEKLCIRFDPIQIEDAEQTRKEIETAAKAGATLPNEVRELLLDKPPFKTGGDQVWLPKSMVAVEMGNEIEVMQPEPETPFPQDEPPSSPDSEEPDNTVDEGDEGGGEGSPRTDRNGNGRLITRDRLRGASKTELWLEAFSKAEQEIDEAIDVDDDGNYIGSSGVAERFFPANRGGEGTS